MDPQDLSLDPEMGRRSISRCHFATRGSIREVHHLTPGFEPLKGGLIPSTGAVYGEMAHWGIALLVRGSWRGNEDQHPAPVVPLERGGHLPVGARRVAVELVDPRLCFFSSFSA